MPLNPREQEVRRLPPKQNLFTRRPVPEKPTPLTANKKLIPSRKNYLKASSRKMKRPPSRNPELLLSSTTRGPHHMTLTVFLTLVIHHWAKKMRSSQRSRKVQNICLLALQPFLFPKLTSSKDLNIKKWNKRRRVPGLGANSWGRGKEEGRKEEGFGKHEVSKEEVSPEAAMPFLQKASGAGRIPAIGLFPSLPQRLLHKNEVEKQIRVRSLRGEQQESNNDGTLGQAAKWSQEMNDDR